MHTLSKRILRNAALIVATCATMVARHETGRTTTPPQRTNNTMATKETTLKHVGWDGRSKPIIELHVACGCRWTKDHSARLASCLQHLISGVAR